VCCQNSVGCIDLFSDLNRSEFYAFLFTSLFFRYQVVTCLYVYAYDKMKSVCRFAVEEQLKKTFHL